MISLNPQRERKSRYSFTMAVPYYSTTARGSKISFRGSIKVSLKPSFRWENPLDILSFYLTIFFLFSLSSSYLNITTLSHMVVLLHHFISFLSYNWGRLFFISKGPIIPLFLDTPTKVRQNLGTKLLMIWTFKHAFPLGEEVQKVIWVAPTYSHFLSHKVPNLSWEGAIDKKMISHF